MYWTIPIKIFFEFIKRNAPRLRKIFSRGGGVLPNWFGRLLARMAQIAAENRNSRIRKQMLKMDQQLGDLLSFTGRGE